MEATRGTDVHARAESWIRPALAVLAISQIAAGAWEALSPSSFYRPARIGPFNDHFIRDLATLYVAYGVALLGAIRRPTWRVPVLALGTVQYLLHFMSHLVDIGKAIPGGWGRSTPRWSGSGWRRSPTCWWRAGVGRLGERRARAARAVPRR
jgi:hypothetical protein